MSSTDVFALSIHADYRCRHSGVCCSTDWHVPIELPVYRTLTEAVESGRLRTQESARHLVPFIVEPDLPEGTAAMFERTEAGECVFLEQGTKLCIVHRDLGESALPATCRHFPRLAVRDTRGTFLTLSHFCPTAASMLFRDDCPLTIVARPAAFPPADYEGLVVTDADLPPLLSPTMFMDGPGYSAWERHMVERCGMPGIGPDAVLATLQRDARLLRAWKPGGATLVDAIRDLPYEPEHASVFELARCKHGPLLASPERRARRSTSAAGRRRARHCIRSICSPQVVHVRRSAQLLHRCQGFRVMDSLPGTRCHDDRSRARSCARRGPYRVGPAVPKY